MENFRKLLDKVGVEKGDILNVVSDVTGLMLKEKKRGTLHSKADYGPYLDELIEDLKDAVGEEGTLLFPTYNMGFCAGQMFDYNTTPGNTGILANRALINHEEFVRTKNPTHSFAVWGKDTEFLEKMDNQESTGKDSPYAYMHERNAKMLLINVPITRPFTFMHYVEQCVDVPYRYHKYFIGKYRNKEGIETIRCYSVFVRDLAIKSEVIITDDIFGAARDEITMHASDDLFELETVRLKPAYKYVEDDLLNNSGRGLYKFDNYELDWGVGKTHEYEIADRIKE